MKKLVLTVSIAVLALSAQAQFGKALKDIGKAATTAATETASDAAATKVAVKLSAYMDSQNKVVAADSPYATRLATITAGLTTVEGAPALNYKAYESAEANIITCADGSIRVYSAMMDALTDDELYAIIADQIGHLVNKDVRNNMMKIINKDQASGAAAAQLNKVLSMTGDKLGTIVNEIVQIPYTEAQCAAADLYASNLLKSNAKKSAVLASALNKFAAMEQADADAAASGDAAAVISPANKYIAVNPNNASRAAAVK